MRRTPPGTNNPSNPLNKVAALQLDREELPKGKIRVKAKLSFKRSDDMRGEAEREGSGTVTVSFSLAVRRATMQLRFAYCDPPKASSLTVSEIAHLHPLVAKQKVKATQSANKLKRGKLSGALGGIAVARTQGTKGQLSAKAQASGEITRSGKRTTATTQIYSLSNVSATSDGDLSPIFPPIRSRVRG